MLPSNFVRARRGHKGQGLRRHIRRRYPRERHVFVSSSKQFARTPMSSYTCWELLRFTFGEIVLKHTAPVSESQAGPTANRRCFNDEREKWSERNGETPSLSLRLRSVRRFSGLANATRTRSNTVRVCSTRVRSSFDHQEKSKLALRFLTTSRQDTSPSGRLTPYAICVILYAICVTLLC